MMDCMMGGNCMGMMWLMWLFWILLIAALAAGIYWLVKRNRTAPRPPTARETLEQHYAAGDLSTEEYEERKQRLDT